MYHKLLAPLSVLLTAATVMAAGSAISQGWLDYGTENPYRAFNTDINARFFHLLGLEGVAKWAIDTFGENGGYYFHIYMRDFIGGTCVYWITATIWHIVIYKVLVKQLFHDKGRALPTTAIMIDSIMLAQSSLFVYAGLPIISEWLIENGLTHTYFYLSDIGGLPYYLLFLVIYICLVEIGIYWVHRTEHTNKFLYKYVHGLHHKYNKLDTLTPWASIAFNPLDGIFQASPYVICLFFVPMHYFTHIFLLFFSGVWATNIHDALWGDTEPIMGSKYHTLHHTHYLYNYGQFFTFCDAYWGTLKVPTRSKLD
jgi:lathosterol oxidase